MHGLYTADYAGEELWRNTKWFTTFEKAEKDRKYASVHAACSNMKLLVLNEWEL